MGWLGGGWGGNMKGSGESKANRRLTQDSSACCQKSCFFEGTTVHALMIFPFLCKKQAEVAFALQSKMSARKNISMERKREMSID